MKKNSIFIMLLCIIHTTTCQAHIIKSGLLIILGGYLGVRWTQANFAYDKTQTLILKDAEYGCNYTISTLQNQCGNQEVCQKMIALLETCKNNLKKETELQDATKIQEAQTNQDLSEKPADDNSKPTH